MSARPAEPPPAGGASAHAARFAAAGRVAPAARDAAARAIVDTLAVMVAGGQAGPVRRLEMTLAPAAGQGVRSPWSEAAYAPQDAHMLDYDDVSMLTVCHPSGPVLSALLAGGLDAVSGAELLDAFAIGTEVSIRLGEAMGFRHYGLGFHATSTLGTVGAAAASARLKRLEPATVAHALAIAASLAIALPVGTLLAVAGRAVRWPLYCYVELFRGTSLVVQLFWMYFVLPQFGILLSAFTVAVTAIALNYGAYGAVIVRGAVVAVDRHQWEAARSLALPRWPTLRHIVFPQAGVLLIKPLGVLYIQLVKATSLVSLITIPDLAYRAYQLNQLTMQTAHIFGVVLVIYFVMTKSVATASAAADRMAGRWRRLGAQAR